jgi:hypothetical protein
MSIIDYGEVSIPGLGCDSCTAGREFLVVWFVIFGVTGGLITIVGIWAIVNGTKERTEQRKA